RTPRRLTPWRSPATVCHLGAAPPAGCCAIAGAGAAFDAMPRPSAAAATRPTTAALRVSDMRFSGLVADVSRLGRRGRGGVRGAHDDADAGGVDDGQPARRRARLEAGIPNVSLPARERVVGHDDLVFDESGRVLGRGRDADAGPYVQSDVVVVSAGREES